MKISRAKLWTVAITIPDGRTFTWRKCRGVMPWTAAYSAVRYGVTEEGVPMRELITHGYTSAVYPEMES